MEEGSRARPSRRSSAVPEGTETPDRAEALEDAEQIALAPPPSAGELLPSANVPLSSAAGRAGPPPKAGPKRRACPSECAE